MKSEPKLPPVRVKIEIPRDCEVKYEYDLVNKVMVVDRILSDPLPYNYGFVPDTEWHDGDPLDVIVLGDFQLHPGVELDARPVGVIKMYDQGESDWKLVCVPLGQVEPAEWYPAIRRYLLSYKKGVKIRGVILNPDQIYKTVVNARQRFSCG